MELDFDKYCVIDGSPKTVLRAPRNPSKAANKESSVRPKRIDSSSRLSKDFREISFNRYRSASCRDARSRKSNEECNNNASLRKRGSVYQSSKDVSFLKKNDADAVSERKKIEFSRGTVPEISFDIIDSLCISDENGFSAMSRSEQCTASCKNRIDFMSESASPHSSQERETDIALRLPKSLSSRTALSRSDTINSGPISPKVRFNSSKKTIDDPYVKSKYHRSPLSSVNRTSSESTSADTSMACEDVICSNDTSEKHISTSPAHLNGIVKIDNKHGFEFSVKSPEELYLAKTWKVENDATRVYTFHSLHPRRRKSNASGWGHRDSCRESAVLGQMHVSCHRCNESNGSVTADDKMVTEFVLYDVSHSRRSNTSSRGEDNQSKYSRDISDDDSRLSNSKPIPSSDLHPVQETAAIVIEAPIEKRVSLKFKTCDKGTVQPLPSLLELCQMERANEGSSDISTRGTTLHVVVPCGQHGSPSSESSRGPNLLLERWRLGGGCDCGGWDMACPLNIFRNNYFSISDGPKLINDRNPAEIFSLGKKDDIPAFTMRKIEGGKYAVNFHAQLSSLQAFSICVAILHSSADESAVVVGRHRIIRKQTLHQSDSLRVFPEEEIDNLIDTLSQEEEEEKLKLHRKNKERVSTTQSFVVNPPFSPIARV